MSSSSNRSPMMGMHSSPLASVTAKLTASGVTISANITRSPSFSRCSSSTTITNFPALRSSMASSMLQRGIKPSFLYRRIQRYCQKCLSYRAIKLSTYFAMISISRLTRSPTPFSCKFVFSSVNGITDKVKVDVPFCTTVRLIPSTAMNPFSTM